MTLRSARIDAIEHFMRTTGLFALNPITSIRSPSLVAQRSAPAHEQGPARDDRRHGSKGGRRGMLLHRRHAAGGSRKRVSAKIA